MDLQKIRELAAQVERDQTPEDAILAADALNYAADEIERLSGDLRDANAVLADREPLTFGEREQARAQTAIDRGVIELQKSEVDRLRSVAASLSAKLAEQKAEIATLRSMVPTLKDGEAKS